MSRMPITVPKMARREAGDTRSFNTSRPRAAAISGAELMIRRTLATVVSRKAITSEMEAQQKHDPTARPDQCIGAKRLMAARPSWKTMYAMRNRMAVADLQNTMVQLSAFSIRRTMRPPVLHTIADDATSRTPLADSAVMAGRAAGTLPALPYGLALLGEGAGTFELVFARVEHIDGLELALGHQVEGLLDRQVHGFAQRLLDGGEDERRTIGKMRGELAGARHEIGQRARSR